MVSCGYDIGDYARILIALNHISETMEVTINPSKEKKLNCQVDMLPCTVIFS